jgi:hypothetical protein
MKGEGILESGRKIVTKWTPLGLAERRPIRSLRAKAETKEAVCPSQMMTLMQRIAT